MSDEPRTRQQRALASAQAKAQEVIKEDFDKAKGLVTDAAKSRAYLYPIKVSPSIRLW
jgi:hypothetical protein